MKEIRTEIQIQAATDKVWQVLTDFDRYPEWNPFMKYLKGKPIEGQKIEVKLISPGSNGMIFKPKVLKFQSCKEFRWLGHIIMPGLFDGEHVFELISLPNDATLFIQREKFNGILVPFLKKALDKSNTKIGFEAMNKELKHLCEMKKTGLDNRG